MIRLLPLSLAACVALAACSAQQQNQAQQSAQSAGVAAEVHAKLLTIDADSTTAVKVDVSNDGVVTLTGEARDAQQRSAYEAAAASVSGVKRVDDRLRINPGVRGPKETLADAALATKVSANIAAQAGVNVANVKPGVHDGVVTLTGTAPTAAVKETILEAARRTGGVKSVIDRIEVKS